MADFIDHNDLKYSTYFQDPSSIVGKRIQHKFEIENSDKTEWFDGTIVGYDSIDKKHEIRYDGETEHCKFDLILDLLNGDLLIS